MRMGSGWESYKAVWIVHELDGQELNGWMRPLGTSIDSDRLEARKAA